MHCAVLPCGNATACFCRQCVLLAVALAIGQWLEKRKVAWLGEASVALLIGILMGLLSRVFTFSATYVSWMSFQVSSCDCGTTQQAWDCMLLPGCWVKGLPQERPNSRAAQAHVSTNFGMLCD